MGTTGIGGLPPTITPGRRIITATPHRSVLFRFYCKGFDSEHALFFLLRTIMEGKFYPFYGKEESERNFLGLLCESASGRYKNTPPDNMDDWKDLLNSIAGCAKANKEYLISERKNSTQMDPKELLDVKTDLMEGIINLKIVEDWFCHHLDALQKAIESGPDLKL